MNWISAAPFEATVTLESGGADIVWIPANAILKNVLLPPEPNFGDPDSGARPVEFDYEGVTCTATIHDFMVEGACTPEPLTS